MTATIVPPATTTEAATVRRTARPIPTTRLVKVELRKMFNTRSGFWMLISIGVLSVIATGAVIIFAPDSDVTYQSFAKATAMEPRPTRRVAIALAPITRPRLGTSVNVVSPLRWLHSLVTARIAIIGKITDIGRPIAVPKLS